MQLYSLPNEKNNILCKPEEDLLFTRIKLVFTDEWKSLVRWVDQSLCTLSDSVYIYDHHQANGTPASSIVIESVLAGVPTLFANPKAMSVMLRFPRQTDRRSSCVGGINEFAVNKRHLCFYVKQLIPEEKFSLVCKIY